MNVLASLRGGLIVSVQAEADSMLHAAPAIALLARVAEQNGAAGVRIEGLESLAAVRAALRIPIVGILKRHHKGFEPYITSTRAEVGQVAQSGAQIVAFDATLRNRADGSAVLDLTNDAHDAGLLAMADCSCIADARGAIAAGCDLISTTLAGYTSETKGCPLPALDLVTTLASEHPFVVCEGGIAAPQMASAALAAGASAIVVGTAITNIDALVRAFVPKRPSEFA